MKALIVNSLELICKIGIFVFAFMGVVSGWSGGGIMGAIAGLLLSFVVSTILFGFLFVLIEMNENTRAIRSLLEKHEKS